MSVIDLTGLKQGCLTVLNRAENAPGSTRARWLCQCDCGRQVIMRSDVLRRGAGSCGCVSASFDHGECRGAKPSRLYNIWRDMQARCKNPKNIGYHLYGGRGITVCDEWAKFKSFKNWADSAGYAENLTLDRIDPNGPYEPENCRWVTNTEQQRNKRNTVWVEFQGIRRSLPEWAELLGVKRNLLYKRQNNPEALQKFIAEHWNRKDLEELTNE